VIEVFMFLAGILFASSVWLLAHMWRETRDNREAIREAERTVEEIWFGDDRE